MREGDPSNSRLCHSDLVKRTTSFGLRLTRARTEWPHSSNLLQKLMASFLYAVIPGMKRYGRAIRTNTSLCTRFSRTLSYGTFASLSNPIAVALNRGGCHDFLRNFTH
jgi:hypothetical protein